MKKLMFATLLLAAGCGTLFNKRHVDVTIDPGVSVDGAMISTELDQQATHMVTYPDGRVCRLEPGVSVGYLLLDIFFTGPIGIIVDAVTGDWKVAKGDCPGVYKR